jgi:hypothetical protein
MKRLEIESCLESMSILTDSREQPSERAKRRYESFGCPYRRQKLEYGDYTYNFILPNGEELYKREDKVNGSVVVERKMNLDELAQCYTHGRKRFSAEFERIRENNAKCYLLVENANWELLLNGQYRSQFNPKSFKASLTAYMARYNTNVIFCKAESSGGLIKEVLYRELKERLDNGFYDYLII